MAGNRSRPGCEGGLGDQTAAGPGAATGIWEGCTAESGCTACREVISHGSVLPSAAGTHLC